ncbi:hypothetical protein SAMN06264364_10179 [Quadrisphaera granulorum]|uniref:Uncharacterized protein n=1 Tax=Quadrisphaera granulorum TaxID=317664 RepID=A0A316AGP5_9ACTN|nr:hypothetical protein [Quadrisphaera granulorum]PWJ56104.1 hypothetical protein BXY45_10179 [Quadrisphaera granulorum]SZE94738.1 hypothetical protein SAMN06264364_10179 [Quadrisphaera granulorum]
MTDSPHERAERELGRVLTRLAALGPSRLSRAAEGLSPAELVRPVLQELADAAATVEGRPARVVPVLEDRALGDQLAVLGRDLLVACRGSGDDAPLADAAARLEALRRAL